MSLPSPVQAPSAFAAKLREIAGDDGVVDNPEELLVYECDAYTLERQLPTCRSPAANGGAGRGRGQTLRGAESAHYPARRGHEPERCGIGGVRRGHDRVDAHEPDTFE